MSLARRRYGGRLNTQNIRHGQLRCCPRYFPGIAGRAEAHKDTPWMLKKRLSLWLEYNACELPAHRFSFNAEEYLKAMRAFPYWVQPQAPKSFSSGPRYSSTWKWRLVSDVAAFPKEYHVYCLRKGLACEHPALTPAELAAYHLLDDPVDFWKTLDQVACSPDPKTPAMEATGDFSL